MRRKKRENYLEEKEALDAKKLNNLFMNNFFVLVHRWIAYALLPEQTLKFSLFLSLSVLALIIVVVFSFFSCTHSGVLSYFIFNSPPPTGLLFESFFVWCCTPDRSTTTSAFSLSLPLFLFLSFSPPPCHSSWFLRFQGFYICVFISG